jgi:hypothetical protein
MASGWFDRHELSTTRPQRNPPIRGALVDGALDVEAPFEIAAASGWGPTAATHDGSSFVVARLDGRRRGARFVRRSAARHDDDRRAEVGRVRDRVERDPLPLGGRRRLRVPSPCRQLSHLPLEIRRIDLDPGISSEPEGSPAL